MKLADARTIVARNTSAPVSQVDPFAGLPDDLLTELRAILTPAVTNRLVIEVDPVTKSAVGVGVGNAIYRVAVVTSPSTGEQRAAILDNSMREISKDEFHARISQVCPPAPPEPAPTVVLPTNDPPTKSYAAQTVELLTEIRDLLRARPL